MPQRITSFVPGVSSRVLAVVALAALPGSVARAADNCLAEPSAKVRERGHWAYHTDWATGRRCWYEVKGGPPSPQAEAPEPPPPNAPSQPGWSSFFSWLAAPFTPTNPAATRQDPANGDADLPPSALTNQDDSPSRMASRPNSSAAPDQTRHRHSPVRPQHAARQRAAPDRKTEQDALFEEFLRWRKQQKPY
jgi:hypothetical protein